MGCTWDYLDIQLIVSQQFIDIYDLRESSFLGLDLSLASHCRCSNYCCHWSHWHTPYSVGILWRRDRPVRETSLPDNTQHSHERDIHAPGGIRTRSPSKQAPADLRLRPLGQWYRPREIKCVLRSSGWAVCAQGLLNTVCVASIADLSHLRAIWYLIRWYWVDPRVGLNVF